MNQIVRTDERTTAIENRIDRNISDSIAVGTGGITFQNAGEVMEYAKMMAVSGSAVPKHLRGQPGACLGIIDDAIRFRTSPYALARKSFFVNDNLAYEAQVIAGIVNRFAPLTERPDVTYSGEGSERKCFVTFKFRDGAVRVYESPAFKNINPKNSPLWKNDPDQQQAYYSLRAGARRYCPEVILGMFDVDELRHTIEHHEVEERPTLADRLAQAKQEAPQAREGFDPAFVARETAEPAGEPETEHEPSPSAPVPPEDDTAAESTPVGSAATESAPASSQESGGVEADAQPPAEQEQASASPVDPVHRSLMVECLDKFLAVASDPKVPDAKQRQENLIFVKNAWKEEIKTRPDFVKACTDIANKVIKGQIELSDARGQLERWLP